MKNQVNSKQTLIVGMGETGFSVARFLQSRHIKFSAVDSRDLFPGYQNFLKMFPKVEIRTGAFVEQDFLSADKIILSPGVSPKTKQIQQAVNVGTPVISDIELFAQYVNSDKTVVAITGTNGKSTVTALVTEMVRQADITVVAGANFGTPALDLLDNDQAPDLYVLELSSFQLETTYSLKPSVSVILNISEDHLDRYDSVAEYLSAKKRIHKNSCCVVANRESQATKPDTVPELMISFGMDAAKDNNFGLLQSGGEDYIAYGNDAWIGCYELENLPGTSGILNAQAALAIGQAIGLPKMVMLSVLRSFRSLPHRMQSIGELKGAEWINDSKATNVAATAMALAGLKRPCIWIGGGDGKGTDFTELCQLVNNRVRAAFLFGKDKVVMAESLQNTKCAIELVDDLSAAMHAAYQRVKSGDCVLLSPACASLDMYDSYIERGNHFVELFNELSNV